MISEALTLAVVALLGAFSAVAGGLAVGAVWRLHARLAKKSTRETWAMRRDTEAAQAGVRIVLRDAPLMQVPSSIRTTSSSEVANAQPPEPTRNYISLPLLVSPKIQQVSGLERAG